MSGFLKRTHSICANTWKTIIVMSGFFPDVRLSGAQTPLRPMCTCRRLYELYCTHACTDSASMIVSNNTEQKCYTLILVASMREIKVFDWIASRRLQRTDKLHCTMYFVVTQFFYTW